MKLLILMLFGFLNLFCFAGFASGGGDHSMGEHMGGSAGTEGDDSVNTSYGDSQGTGRGEGPTLNFRYEPACASYNPPGTSNSSAPFGGAGGTGLNQLSCDESYIPLTLPPTQQAGEVGILGKNLDDPKLVRPNNQAKGVTEVNPEQ